MRKLTTQEFIKKARVTHGDKYDYSLVEYKNTNTKIKIICPIHGVFEQAAYSHIKGFGCSACSGLKKRTTNDFIEDAKHIHGDKYGYAFSIYINIDTDLFIYCREHKLMFKQRPHAHLKGSGCQKCKSDKLSKINIMSEDIFIEKAKKIHGNDKYDYCSINYIRANTKINITCKIHGKFKQTPSSHLCGRGCPKCGNIVRANKKTLNLEAFINRSEKVHGKGRYDYSDVNYTLGKKKVKINCPIHGSFYQTAHAHMYGLGCISCAGTKLYTTQEFINKARSVHGNKYDYSITEYKGANRNKVKIICHSHGMFEQNAGSHLSGRGCPGCGNYGFDRTKDGYIYLLRSECGQYGKIGITHKPKQRHVQLTKATPFQFNVIECIRGSGEHVAKVEKKLLDSTEHVEFSETFDGSSEWRLWSDSIRHKLISFMNKELTNGPV